MTSRSETGRPATRNEDVARGELDALRAILVGTERLEIEALKNRLGNRRALARDLSDALPQAIRLRHKQDGDLTRALEQPLRGSIHRTIRRDPQSFADALFPVIGPAIRRAIAEALRGLVQNINRTLDHSLSLRGLRWRWEAMRSGVPFGEVVVRHTLAYRVEQAFLIRPDNGLLIEQVTDERVVVRDADAVTAMLTAIQRFVKDAFAADEPIDSVEMGDDTVWLLHGPQAYLACAIRGLPPRRLREQLDEVIRDIHAQYGDELAEFDGDRTNSEGGIRLELSRCLVSEQKDQERLRRGIAKPVVVLLIAALAAAGWFAHHLWQDRQVGKQRAAAYEDLIERLGDTPGYVLTATLRGPEGLQLQGLRDTLAAPPETLLVGSELTMEQVDMRWRPYQSAEPTIALARARQRLSPPEGVALDLTPDGRLVASGVAEPAWIDRAALLAPTVPGIASLDTAKLQTSDAALEAIARERLAPLAGISVRAHAGALQLTGPAPAAWIESVPQRLGDIAWLKHLDLSGLDAEERLELARLRTTIEGTRILFARGSAELSQHSQDQLTRLAAQTRRAAQLAATLGLQTRLQLIGRTDGIGDPKQNARLAVQRTRRSAEFLLNLGIEAAELDEQPTPTRGLGSASKPQLRRVEFRLDLLPKGKDE